ncbi:MAG: hypothetical protein M1829_001179 [Trizodia sp. TS-e1964]|nr:MAG: hypothetical protein M1829_001179 [Trizodia sp. TS-e1964]
MGLWDFFARETQPAAVPNLTANQTKQAADVEQHQPRKLTRDEAAELELQEFLSSLSEETATPTSSPSHSSTEASESSPVPEDIATSSLFPRTMSCRQAFDAAFYCQSLGGQFVNVYRYGGMRDCSTNWADFRFCIRVKSYGESERAKAVQAHYMRKAAKYKTGPSSEDVWQLRKEPLEGAFTLPLPESLDEGREAEADSSAGNPERGAQNE